MSKSLRSVHQFGYHISMVSDRIGDLDFIEIAVFDDKTGKMVGDDPDRFYSRAEADDRFDVLVKAIEPSGKVQVTDESGATVEIVVKVATPKASAFPKQTPRRIPQMPAPSKMPAPTRSMSYDELYSFVWEQVIKAGQTGNKTTRYMDAIRAAIFDSADWKKPVVLHAVGLTSIERNWISLVIEWDHAVKAGETWACIYSQGYSAY